VIGPHINRGVKKITNLAEPVPGGKKGWAVKKGSAG